MKRLFLMPLLIAAAPTQIPAPPALAPSEIVTAAAAQEWVSIAPADLMVIDLAPDGKGSARRVVSGLPGYQYLSTESASFARYADARANRRDAFFIRPARGADICNIPVPVRRMKAGL